MHLIKTALAIAGLTAPLSQAAIITWDAAATISADTDILAAGTTDFAYSFGALSSVTLNGVTFSKVTPGGSGNDYTWTGLTATMSTKTIAPATTYLNGTNAAPVTSLSSGYQDILKGGFYTQTMGSTMSVQLTNLVIGNEYAVQFWSNDSRGYGGINLRQATISGTSIVMDYNTSDALNGVGQYVIGRFVADASTQTFSLGGSSYPQINAIQLRDLGTPVPEPAGYALATAGTLATLSAIRRRRKRM